MLLWENLVRYFETLLFFLILWVDIS
jgi:hypothetical protein